MKAGGRIGFEHVAWFNGGLFDDDDALPLTKEEITLTLRAANLDWAESTRPSSAPCSNGVSIRISGRSLARIIPIATRLC
jgi:hypothetical protein